MLDQDEALDFYVGKLGFSVYTDVKAEGLRFVLVTAVTGTGTALRGTLRAPTSTPLRPVALGAVLGGVA